MDAVLGVCCTQRMLFSVYALLGVCYTRGMLYPVPTDVHDRAR